MIRKVERQDMKDSYLVWQSRDTRVGYPSQKQDSVGKDRKSRKAGYEGSLTGKEIPRYQGRSPSRMQEKSRHR